MAVTPTTIPFKPPPIAIDISITTNVCGTDKTKSINQVTTASTLLPKVGPIIPKIIAIIVLVRVAKRPIFILKLKPFIVLVSISLPTQSVPNR